MVNQASISCWTKISLLTGFVLAASVGACEKDTTDQKVWAKGFDSGWTYWVVDHQGDIARKVDLPHDTTCLVYHFDGKCELDHPDTAREYMRVDTVLTCPECWELMDYMLPIDTVGGQSGAKRCKRISVVLPNLIESQAPDTTIDTTWFTKVQVWLTLEERTRLKQVLCDHGYDPNEPWIIAGSWTCPKCGEVFY